MSAMRAKKYLIVSLVISITTLFLMRIQVGHHVRTILDTMTTSPGTTHDKTMEGAQKGPYDILINTYMRSGSTYMGQKIGLRPDNFYLYEPLHPTHTWHYHNGSYMLCSYTQPSCEPSNETSSLSYNNSINYLSDFFNCRLRPHLNRFSNFVVGKSGSGWKTYRQCLKKGRKREECVSRAEQSCSISTRRVTKLLRMTVDGLEPLLERNKRLKVIHILRDPRGIVKSRINARWYTLYRNLSKTDLTKLNSKPAFTDVVTLCRRMEHDIKEGKKLQVKYPGRFSFVQFEDTVSGHSIAKLMKHLEIYDTIHDSNVSNPKAHYDVFSYRDMLPYTAIQHIDEQCKNVYGELGLRRFSSKEDYMNKTKNVILDKLPFRLN